MRGNPSPPPFPPPETRTIPARAGEPRCRRHATPSSRDYPRSCGGTSLKRRRESPLPGLSPLVRGNLGRCQSNRQRIRTIPARAGEPLPIPFTPPISWDYPRSCGGTRSISARRETGGGLSPLVRGNRGGHEHAEQLVWTIPARAGEPEPGPPGSRPAWDYPRSCGGTDTLSRPGRSRVGLSPLVRGNHQSLGSPGRMRWTIPARAGEPVCDEQTRFHGQDYPRSCGGTNAKIVGRKTQNGLSPLVRGNRCRQRSGVHA